jgi:hypothetical protein
MYYLDYVRWLSAEHSKIVLDPGAIEVGPLHNYTQTPSSPPWNMDWLVRFSDAHHAYLKERWWPETIASHRSANFGYRKHFSFHYGPTNPATDAKGYPVRDPGKFPPIFRIDCDKHGANKAHIHMHGNRHIYQNRIQGFIIKTADPFDFMKAVLEYRATQSIRDFDAILGFRVLP